MNMFVTFDSSEKEFSVETGDFSQLEIRSADEDTGFCYFYDAGSRRLITDFVLDDRPQVATLCRVTLIKKGEAYSPRIRLWKKDKTQIGRTVRDEVGETEITKLIKATVDTNDCHENFWKLINFLQSFSEITLPDDDFQIVPGDSAALVRSLELQDKQTIVEAVRTALGSSLTEADIALMANRKEQLEIFHLLLTDAEYFEVYRSLHSIRSGNEAVWQHYFEANQWIFGYGLSLITCQSLDHQRLEQITTGANIFSGAGKRSDAVLRSKGYISSLIFAEIKTPSTELLAPTPYRPPDIYRPSNELSGGVAQLQKTAEKAVRGITSLFRKLYDPSGTPLGVEVSTVKPKQVLIVGQLDEFAVNGDINPEKFTSFELYRRSIGDVEIITFDELYERAKFIVTD